MHCIVVGHIEEALFEEASRSVRDHTVTFHLAKTETTIARTTFSRLTGEDLCGSSASRVNLVSHHMLQSLIEGRAEEDHHLETFTCEARVHDFVAVTLVTKCMQHAGHKLDSLPTERRSVSLVSVDARHF